MDPDRPYFADAIAWDRHRTSKGSKWMLDWLPTSPGLPLVGLPPDAPTFDASCRQSYAAAQLTCSPSVLDVVPNNTLHFDAKFVDADAANTLVTSHFDCLMAISPCFAGKPILCPHSQYIFKNPPACSFYSLARGVLHGPFAHSFADAIDWDRHRTSKGSRRMLDWLPTSPGLPPVGLPPDAPTLGLPSRSQYAAAQQACLSSVLDVATSMLLQAVLWLVPSQYLAHALYSLHAPGHATAASSQDHALLDRHAAFCGSCFANYIQSTRQPVSQAASLPLGLVPLPIPLLINALPVPIMKFGRGRGTRCASA